MACRNMSLILNFSIGNTNFSFLAFDLNNSKNEIIDCTSYSIVVPLYLNYCNIGEVFDFDLFHCLLCPENFFSFNPEDMNCHPCLENSVCYGGAEIDINENFWRSSIKSTNVYDCHHEFVVDLQTYVIQNLMEFYVLFVRKI